MVSANGAEGENTGRSECRALVCTELAALTKRTVLRQSFLSSETAYLLPSGTGQDQTVTSHNK